MLWPIAVAHTGDLPGLIRSGGGEYPIERELINNAFDNLFDVIKTEETDKGIALYGLGAAAGAAAGATGGSDEDRARRFLYGALGGMVLSTAFGTFNKTKFKLRQNEVLRENFLPVIEEAAKSTKQLIESGRLSREDAGYFAQSKVEQLLSKDEKFRNLPAEKQQKAFDELASITGELKTDVLTGNKDIVKNISESLKPILQRLQEQITEKINAGQMKPENAKIGLRKRVRDYVTFDDGRFLTKDQRDELLNAVGATKKWDDKVFAAETNAIQIAQEMEGFKTGSARIVNDKFVDESVSGLERGILSKAVYEDVKSNIRQEVYSSDKFKNLTKDEKEEVLNTVEKVYKKRYDRAVNALTTNQYGMGGDGFDKDSGVFGQWKDIGPVDRNFIDIQRAFERTVPKNQMAELERMYLEPFAQAEGNRADYQVTMADELMREVVNKYGIEKGSKESELLQAYGEGYRIVNERKGLMNYEERVEPFNDNDLVDEVGLKRAKEIATAEQWFRQKYDEMLTAINDTRKQIYGDNPEHQIQRRKDYFRHYQELTNDLGGLLNIFDISANIDPRLQGISEFTKPKSKWQSFAQRRFGLQTTQDAVGGFLNYLPNAAHAIYMDPMITKFRKLSDALAEGTQQSKHLNNFIGYLRNITEQIAGKTNFWDRWADQIGGRKAMRMLNFISNRVKSNLIIGNISTALGVGANVTLAAPDLARYGTKAAVRTFVDSLHGDGPITKSRYLQERYLGDVYEKFDTGIMQNAKRLSMWLIEQSDKWSTRLIWNALYEKGIDIGAKDPIKFADKETKKVVPGGGIGQSGYALKSSTFQIAAPFQREVVNTWYVLGDHINAKQWGRLMGILAASYAFNRVMAATRGTEVVFDPIQAFIDGARMVYDEENKAKGLGKAAGRMAGEFASNVPLAPQAIGIFADERQMQQFMGSGSGGRFGTGLGVISDVGKNIGNIVSGAGKGRIDLLSAGKLAGEIIPPFGGKQIEKTIRGGYAISNGGIYDRNGRLMFKVDDLSDKVKALFFGPYGTESGKEYLEGKGKNNNNGRSGLPSMPRMPGLPRLPRLPHAPGN